MVVFFLKWGKAPVVLISYMLARTAGRLSKQSATIGWHGSSIEKCGQKYPLDYQKWPLPVQWAWFYSCSTPKNLLLGVVALLSPLSMPPPVVDLITAFLVMFVKLKESK